jgi:hypothetical protein
MRQGHEADHSPLTNAEVRSRKCGSLHPLPHTPSWHSAYLVKRRDNFNFNNNNSNNRRVSFLWKSPVEPTAIVHKLTYVTLRPRRLNVRSSSPCTGKNFLFSTQSRPTMRPTYPPMQPVRGGPLSPGVKRPVREAHHSSQTSDEVKITWIYTSSPTYAFMVWCFII